jgi:hypothetical protein
MSFLIPGRESESQIETSKETRDMEIAEIPPIPSRKGSWLNKPRNERRQSCRRIKSQRDWSEELEESEFHLPFPITRAETERGGHPLTGKRVNFESLLPRIDTSFVGQGLMIDVESPVEGETENSGIESLGSATGSEWTGLSEEAEGIEMYF